MLKVGDNIAVERKTGYTTHGSFVEQDDDSLIVKGTVGDKIGALILIRWENVDQIRILK